MTAHRPNQTTPPVEAPTQGPQAPAMPAVNVSSDADLLADLAAHLQAARGFAVATLNLDHVVKLRRDPLFREAYAEHSHITADGRPIVWLSRLSGQPVDLVTGSDLIDPLMALAARLEVPVALVGSTDEVLADAAHELQQRHKGLSIVLTHAPEMGFDPVGPAADNTIEALRASGARLCLLAFGAPKQERFAAHASQAMPETGFVSIGAGLDFIAGTQTRAPRIMRILALEWVWRLMNDPRRLAGRYAACAVVLPGLLRIALRNRFAQKKEAGA